MDTMAALTEGGVVDTGDALIKAAGCSRAASVKFLLQRQLKVSPTGVIGYANCCNPYGVTLMFSGVFCRADAPHLISPRVV